MSNQGIVEAMETQFAMQRVLCWNDPDEVASSRVDQPQLEHVSYARLKARATSFRSVWGGDLRISLEVEDGVKVNCGKFGDLLAEVKAVAGGVTDE